MDYQFKKIEKDWQQYWAKNQTFKAETNSDKPKYYVLDMFPYPSGAGLHVGHPLGYIASDIFARYKRLKDYNVLHPMGYDSFGLPAEQYAIQTGQHPAFTTKMNIDGALDEKGSVKKEYLSDDGIKKEALNASGEVIVGYRKQMEQFGFSFDWSREVRTSDPNYYKWTQWIFMQLFNSWYNLETDRAEDITTLIEKFNASGSADVKAVCDEDTKTFLPSDWANFTHEEKQRELLKYRLTYLKESTVNWCPALGTVLANDEMKDGFSERGGHPVEQKKMMQWSMRISAYAERLLQGLNTIDWPEPVKEMQRNWIGKSVGASVRFKIDDVRFTDEGQIENQQSKSVNQIEVFTTRVDTIFGVSFIVLAPEHELVAQLTTEAQKTEIENYIAQTKKKSELDRMADTKTVSGAFTGSYVINPVNGEKVPIWIADYVLAGYGTGAVMGVPSGDQRDWLFATHFDLPKIQILDGQKEIENQANATKEGKYINSGFINGMEYKEAIAFLNDWLEKENVGKAKINYRMRDAIFGRQRYWGEPIPVYFKDGLPYLIKEEELPLVLPEIDKYLPTETGEPPLGRAEGWSYDDRYEYELSTMPGWAGSSWYWYRYMDAKNDNAFASKEAVDYWKDVDLYIGGSEHSTGHLLYSRFWNKFLKDLGYVTEEEPFKKLINQGMIQGRSNFVYKINGNFSSVNFEGDLKNVFVSYSFVEKFEKLFIRLNKLTRITFPINSNIFQSTEFPHILLEEERSFLANFEAEFIKIISQNSSITLNNKSFTSQNVDVNIVENDILDINKFRSSREEYANAEFILENGKYICGIEVEKMSKSKWNVVNPDVLIEQYGADTLRMYEMFLGPLEQSKPWNTNGIEGVFKFLRKFWRLFHNEAWEFTVSDAEPTKAELKALHKIIKKVQDDIERFSFNTSVSSFMIAVNELTDLKCNKREILKDLVVILSPYAPHICEELWSLLGYTDLSHSSFPIFNPDHLVEDEFAYPISINGKMKMNLNLSLNLDETQVRETVLSNEQIKGYLEGKAPKKIIYVKGKIVNIVV